MTPVEPRRGYTRCRFGQLHHRTAGAGGIPLVLLHQTPSSSADFIPLMHELASDRRVIAFDTPGFGMSDPPPAPLSLPDYAAAFADALDDLALAQVDVLGYHTGAYLAVELALARPDRVRRLILSGIPFRPAAERAARLTAAAPPDTSEDGIFSFLRNLWTFSVAARDPSVSLDRAITLFTERTRAMHRAAWPYEGVWRFDAESRFAALTQPVLVLQPHDPLFSAWRTPVALIADATVLEFPYLTRDVFDAGAVELARAIREWA
jgi:pimeloyl-ACP methyl ester carboxylesterase